MDKSEILFLIAVLGFFGISGLDLINLSAKIVNVLYIKIGNLFWLLLITLMFIIINRDN